MRALLAVVLLLATGAASAQIADLPARAGGGALRVDAVDGIEWRRHDKVIIARGDARAVRDDGTVRADTLSAHYRETPGGGTDVYRIEASGHVRIESDGSTLSAAEAVYDIDTDVVVLRGEEIVLTTPQQRVVAHESMEIRNRDHVAIARGDVRATEGDRRLRAEVLTADFARTPKDGLSLQRLQAAGGVVVTTPSEVIRARSATYDLVRETAELTGDVRITRGRNQLHGGYAHLDLKSGVSRLTAGSDARTGGRVQALIVPERGRSRQAAN